MSIAFKLIAVVVFARQLYVGDWVGVVGVAAIYSIFWLVIRTMEREKTALYRECIRLREKLTELVGEDWEERGIPDWARR